MKIEDIVPTPTKETRKTRKMFFNPETGEYIDYNAAYRLKKKGIDLFQNAVDVPDREDSRAPILEERMKFVNLTLEMLTKITNE